MTITDVALTSIAREALRSADGLETGGILLGDDGTDGIGIRHAGGPGPNATRGERTFLRDLDHARRLADSAWLDRSQWIGEWHTHPTGGLSPSEVDLHSYMRHLHDPELGFDRFVAIIAGFDASARVVVATWLVERDRIWSVVPERLPVAAVGSYTYASDAVRQAGFIAEEHKETP
jgi:integrative and conjugative element protein (TIGR02256 family)